MGAQLTNADEGASGVRPGSWRQSGAGTVPRQVVAGPGFEPAATPGLGD